MLRPEKLIIQNNYFVKTISFGDLGSNQVWTQRTDQPTVSNPRLEEIFEERVAERKKDLATRARLTGKPVNFYNSLMPRNESLNLSPGEYLNIKVGVTDYFHYSTATKEAINELQVGDFESRQHQRIEIGKDGIFWVEETMPIIPNPITAVMSVVIEDGKYVIFTKPKQVRDEQDIIGLPGGYGNLTIDSRIDDDEIEGDVEPEKYHYRPELTALRETWEETGIGRRAMENILLRGRVVERATLDKIDTCLIYSAHAPAVTREVLRNTPRKDKDEVDLLALPYNKRDKFINFASSFLSIRQGYTIAALNFLAQDRYGNATAKDINKSIFQIGKEFAVMDEREIKEKFISEADRFSKHTSPFKII